MLYNKSIHNNINKKARDENITKDQALTQNMSFKNVFFIKHYHKTIQIISHTT